MTFRNRAPILLVLVLVLACRAVASERRLVLENGGTWPASAADSPRQRVLMDFGWRFHLGEAPDAGTQFDYPEPNNLLKTRSDDVGLDPAPFTNSDLGSDVSFVQPGFDDSSWRQLDLPHDWAIELPFDPKGEFEHGFKPIGTSGESEHDTKETGPGFPQNSIGWYRQEFQLPESDRGKTLWLEFEGVYRNSLVWLNGHCLGRHPDGYTRFRYDIGRYANYGGKNELAVRVDAWRFEGWFYEGAGIYRHVWLVKTSPLHIAPDGIFVYSKFPNNVPGGPAQVEVQATLVNSSGNSADVSVTHEIFDQHGISVARQTQSAAVFDSQDTLKGGHQTAQTPGELESTLTVPAPALWAPESPNLYRLVTTIEQNGSQIDRVETEFGIRTIAFDADKGFLLNGKPYLIKGTCNHQDYAGLGNAVPDAIQYYRIRKLKEMGCNAYRTAHNAPAPELLEACDRLGMLVMDENRRVDTNATTLDDLASLVLRDRNHPSVFIWSLGNEEPVSGTEQGEQIATVMQGLVHRLDPTRCCTAAMVHGWGQGFSKVLDVQGFNYGLKSIVNYHQTHPAQPEIGTETGSTYVDRGIYADDRTGGYVNSYGEEHPGWGSKPWDVWNFYATHPFASGSFVWVGFDYGGEPKPYRWPSIGSHFGLMDACGFPKDIYYYYKSWWQDELVLHISPHWNWPTREGQTNLVRVFSNCKQVELLLNGKSLGKQIMRPNGYLDWKVVYEPGVLSAKGYDRHGQLITQTKVETTGPPSAIELLLDHATLTADGQDCDVINVSVVDSKGCVVPVADNLIQFDLKGPGKIIAVGNGDPDSHEPGKTNERRLFNGYAQVIVQSDQHPGMIQLTASSPKLQAATLQINAQAGFSRDTYGFRY